MLGIIIGVGAVIVMVAVGYGARTRIAPQINNLGTNMIVITPGAAQQAGVSQGAQAFPNLTSERRRQDPQPKRRPSPRVSPVDRQPHRRSSAVRATGGRRSTASTPTSKRSATGRRRPATSSPPTTSLQPQGRRPRQDGRAEPFPGTGPGRRGDPDPQRRSTKSSACSRRRGRPPAAATPTTSCSCRTPPPRPRSRGRAFIPQILASTANEQDIPAAQDEIRTLLRESHKVERRQRRLHREESGRPGLGRARARRR